MSRGTGDAAWGSNIGDKSPVNVHISLYLSVSVINRQIYYIMKSQLRPAYTPQLCVYGNIIKMLLECLDLKAIQAAQLSHTAAVLVIYFHC